MSFRHYPPIAEMFAAQPPFPKLPRGDALALRAFTNEMFDRFTALAPEFPDVQRTDFRVPVADGVDILARWYTKDGSGPGSAVVYFHGGGMVSASVAHYDSGVAHFVDVSGVPFLSVDYRQAPEHRGPTPADDGFAALQWLRANAGSFGVDPARIAVMGDSAGGGVAAAVAIAARDAGVPLALQILLSPMLDDRTQTPDAHIVPWMTWNYDDNYTGWSSLLVDDLGTDRVSPLSAPARLDDFTGLAPAFIDVGELDIFRNEGVRYAGELWRAGVSAELHVRPGVPHGYYQMVESTPLGMGAWNDQWRILGEL